eukprot:524619-Rhodomonas_salina.1
MAGRPPSLLMLALMKGAFLVALRDARQVQPGLDEDGVDIVDFVASVASGEWEGFNLRTRFYAVDPRVQETLRKNFGLLQR